MAEKRPDLDGERLIDIATSEVWLVFNGVRHLVAAEAYENLFGERERVLTGIEIGSVERGGDLDPGACLVRPVGHHPIYMVTGTGGEVWRHHIPTFECLVDFGFDISKTCDVPEIVVRGLREGEPLVSAARRG